MGVVSCWDCDWGDASSCVVEQRRRDRVEFPRDAAPAAASITRPRRRTARHRGGGSPSTPAPARGTVRSSPAPALWPTAASHHRHVVGRWRQPPRTTLSVSAWRLPQRWRGGGGCGGGGGVLAADGRRHVRHRSRAIFSPTALQQLIWLPHHRRSVSYALLQTTKSVKSFTHVQKTPTLGLNSCELWLLVNFVRVTIQCLRKIHGKIICNYLPGTRGPCTRGLCSPCPCTPIATPLIAVVI